MLSENIKTIRASRGLSQEELAAKLHVVRQTISKWETGLSVPDCDLLLTLSEALDTPVSILLGEPVVEPKSDDLRTISEKLEGINLQLTQRKTAKRNALRWLLRAIGAVTIVAFAVLTVLGSPYLSWNFTNPETAVVGTVLHVFEWLFVRLAPIVLMGTIAGILIMRKRAERHNDGEDKRWCKTPFL